MNNTRNAFDKIKKLFANGFGGLESNYRQRMNLYTDKDLEYFSGEAKNVNVTCIECVALNNCIFYHDNLSNFMHPKCKCIYVPVENVNFTCEMALNKISNYLMVDEGKKIIFEKLGYTKEDSVYLKELISSSALESYKQGKYKIKKIDMYGQRLGIETVVYNKKLTSHIRFYSGWKLFPNGKIINTTPFAGWLKENNEAIR